MNPALFQQLIEPLVDINPNTEQVTRKPAPCEDCGEVLKNRSMKCEAYRIGTDHEHFKHTCSHCKRVFFDGQRKRDPFLKRVKGAPRGARGPYKKRTETKTHIITEY